MATDSLRQALLQPDRYPADWDQVATRIKIEAGWRCESCGHPHDPPTGYTLTVHHLVPVKAFCEPFNLVALCQRCHLRLQPDPTVLMQTWLLKPPEWLKWRLASFQEWRESAREEARDG